MFHPNGHLNKHGFFQVGDQNFYSKLDAIMHSMTTGQDVRWNYNNDVFSKVDWTQEPKSNILELYRQRAQQLRDEYDYLVIMFSGGADSTTVIDTFLRNNIFIDEIVCMHCLEGTGDQNAFYFGEIFNAAIPYLQENIKDPKTKIRIYDSSAHSLACLRDAGFRQRSLRECNNIHNLGWISIHHDIHLRWVEHQALYDQGKRIAWIWGEGKPLVQHDQDLDQHCLIFEDVYSQAPQPRDQEANDPRANHEHFYDDPGWPEIKAKQAHLLVNVMQQINHRSDIFVACSEADQEIIGPRGFRINHPRYSMARTRWKDKDYWLDRNAFNCAIYPGWNFLTYHDDKQYNRLRHPAHEWLNTSAPEEARAWFEGYVRVYGSLPEKWRPWSGSGLSTKIQIKYALGH